MRNGKRRSAMVLLAALALVFFGFNTALAQSGSKKNSEPGTGDAPKASADAASSANIVDRFGKWELLCGRVGPEGTGQERCSLVLTLLEAKSQKLIFRVVVTYGPRGNLILRVDCPTGVALQRGVEFSPDTKKIYRMAYQTCLPVGCKALLLVSDDLKKSLGSSPRGSITVYALNGTPVRTEADLSGFAEGLSTLDKRRAGQ